MPLTKVVSFCLGDIPSARIGIVEPMMELHKAGRINFAFYLTSQLTKEVLAGADVIISIRSVDSYELDVVKECKRNGKMIVYYLDDDLLNIPKHVSGSEYFNSKTVRDNMISIMNHSDYLLTNNPRISNKYANYVLKKSIVVNAPALLLDEVEFESSLKQARDGVRPIIIGFSGGIDHKTNLETILEEPLDYLKNRYGGKISFEFMGAKPDFIKGIPYKYIPYQSDYKDYIKQMKQINWDIAVAPLPKSDFHASKYFNKFLEYGSIGAAGVYSDVDPYRYVVKNNINGLLVENTKDAWIDAISWLIENESVRQKIITEARKQLHDEFTVQHVADSIAENITVLTEYIAPFCKSDDLKLNLGNKELLIRKIGNIIKSMGFKAPLYITKKVFQRIRKRNDNLD